jgi:hypothetical protein
MPVPETAELKWKSTDGKIEYYRFNFNPDKWWDVRSAVMAGQEDSVKAWEEFTPEQQMNIREHLQKMLIIFHDTVDEWLPYSLEMQNPGEAFLIQVWCMAVDIDFDDYRLGVTSKDRARIREEAKQVVADMERWRQETAPSLEPVATEEP